MKTADMQILDASDQGDDFLRQLHRIEFQARRLEQSASSTTNQDLLQDKACDMMIAIIKFFSASFHYFSRSFFSNLPM